MCKFGFMGFSTWGSNKYNDFLLLPTIQEIDGNFVDDISDSICYFGVGDYVLLAYP